MENNKIKGQIKNHWKIFHKELRTPLLHYNIKNLNEIFHL